MSGEPWSDALEAELTFARILARHSYWRENPPANVLLAALAAGLGVWKPEQAPPAASIQTLRALFPSGRI
jgi:hypothetical protein